MTHVLHVLVVDDLEESRYLLRALLDGSGYRVTPAANGVEALAAARREPPDVIVSDALMPKMDGFSLCRAWMQDETLKAIPFVFYSATYTNPEDERFALALGAVRYLIKPQEPEAFLAELNRVLQERSAHPLPAPASLLDEESFRALHDAALARKLEHKITQLETANRELRVSESRYHLLVDQSPYAIGAHQDGRVVFANPAAVRLFGAGSAEELVGKPIQDLIHPDRRDAARERIARLLQGESDLYPVEDRYVRLDGSAFDVEVSAAPFIHQGRVAVQIIALDITERKRAQAEISESAVRLQMAARAGKVGLWDWNLRTNRVFYSAEWKHQIGYEDHEIANDLSEWQSRVHPEDLERTLQTVREFIDKPFPDYCVEFRFRHKDGSYRWILAQADLAYDDQGKPTHMLGSHVDITERRRAERELAEAEDRFRALVEQSLVGIYLTDGEKITYANPRAAEIFGYAQHEANGFPVRALVAEEDWPLVENHIRQRISGAVSSAGYEFRGRRKNGSAVTIGAHITLAHIGGKRVIIGAIQDITERKIMEDQLRHSQKMDAIGQLTGGLAHDFNNLLGIVIGNLDLLALDLGDCHAARRGLNTALAAALRGAELSKRLLAFARREPLSPHSLELNARISECLPMLRDALGPAVELMPRLGGSLTVEVDAGELETVLMNLAINARDAMPRGGRFILETQRATMEENEAGVAAAGEIPAGDYALLTIADTGCGMSEQVRLRALEPFFTTKARGKGTGLGLAMVYSFVQRSGGVLKLRSEEGRGTTFNIYLPISHRAPAAVSAAAAAPAVGGTESILLVDDEADMLVPASQWLIGLGYRVATAAGGTEALARLRAGECADLLFTDVVMPDMDGVELAERARALCPKLRVLLASGFSDAVLAAHTAGALRFPILDKPYRRPELAQAVRRALDNTDPERT